MTDELVEQLARVEISPDHMILASGDWSDAKREECARAYQFCHTILRSPLTEEEFSHVWYSETDDKKGTRHLANMCMSIFQSRKSRAGTQFERAVRSMHDTHGLTCLNQAWVDAEGTIHTNKPTQSCHKVDGLLPLVPHATHIRETVLLSIKTTLRERYRQDLDFVGRCKQVIFLTKEVPESIKQTTLAGYGCICVYPHAPDTDTTWSYTKYVSEMKRLQEGSRNGRG